MFSTSLIVLFSEKKLTAGINAGLYVFLTFAITGIYKYYRAYSRGHSGVDSVLSEIPQILLYSIIPAIVCGILGFILWNGRRNTWIGKILLLTPLVAIIIEMTLMIVLVINHQTMVFQVLLDSVCATIYFLIFKKAVFNKPIKER